MDERSIKMQSPSEPGPSAAASRRLAVLAQQVGAAPGAEQQLQRQATSVASTSYASIDGRPSSYARVHGEVTRRPAVWRIIDVVAKERLGEVVYEKAVGEGIAKVRGNGREGCGRAGSSSLFVIPSPPFHLLLRADHHQPAGQAQRLHAEDG